MGGYIMDKAIIQQGLDQEWVALILEALDLGMTVEEIRAYLLKNRKNKQHHC
jgi:hypothetical protein